MAKKDYSKLNKEDLIALVEKLESRKKYGLVWDEERTKEKFEKDSENALPVLKEVKSKEIKTDLTKSTNILIEGDNYHTLSVLNYTHQGKIDVIYIDPPYNTGNKDFKYNDNYVDKEDAYRHSKWLSFMSKRLRLAKNLLKDDGVIFISIDDNEFAQLKILCDEIFGEDNFVGNIIWHKKDNASFLSKKIVNLKEYILFYSKSDRFVATYDRLINIERHRELITKPSRVQERIFDKDATIIENGKFSGIIKKGKYGNPQFGVEILNDVKIKNGRPLANIKIKGKFCWSQATLDQEIKNGGHIQIKSISGMKPIFFKNFGENIPFRPIVDIFSKVLDPRVKTTQDADKDLKNLFGDSSIFNYSKPKELIEILISSVTRNIKNQYCILDFFAGTGTTGHSVLNLNKEDGIKRTFILCTNNADNICTDVCYPRIQKVIKGYTTPKGQKVDGLGGNLKYFKTAFVKNSIIRDDLKMRITRECTEMLCLREGIFDEVKASDDYRIFAQNGQVMGVYYSLERKALASLKKELGKMKGEKILYCFTLDPLGLDKNDFADWQGVSLEAIPEPILDIYKDIYKL